MPSRLAWPQVNAYPATPVNVMVLKMIGEFLALREIWQKYGANVPYMSMTAYVHDSGHMFGFVGAKRFTEAQFQ